MEYIYKPYSSFEDFKKDLDDVFNKEGALCDRESHKNKVLELCNIAAENFLNLLISK